MLAASTYLYEVVANIGTNWASAKSAATAQAHHHQLDLLLSARRPRGAGPLTRRMVVRAGPGRIVEVRVRRPGALGPVGRRPAPAGTPPSCRPGARRHSGRCPRGTGARCRACARGSTALLGACGSPSGGSQAEYLPCSRTELGQREVHDPAREVRRHLLGDVVPRDRRRPGAPCCSSPGWPGWRRRCRPTGGTR